MRPEYLQKLDELAKREGHNRHQFTAERARQTINFSLQREFKHELEEYSLDKTILNLICDMGYVIQERD